MSVRLSSRRSLSRTGHPAAGEKGRKTGYLSLLDGKAVFFANVPYDLQLKQEKYYQTIFYLIFKLIGLRVEAEARTNEGRIDAVIELADHIFLFEFKLDGGTKSGGAKDGGAEEALQQIKTHSYYEKYRLQPKIVTRVGVNFDSTRR